MVAVTVTEGAVVVVVAVAALVAVAVAFAALAVAAEVVVKVVMVRVAGDKVEGRCSSRTQSFACGCRCLFVCSTVYSKPTNRDSINDNTRSRHALHDEDEDEDEDEETCSEVAEIAAET